LLRFLLDGHPDLACPPETSLPALCGQLATVWSLIEGAPLAAERDAAPRQAPGAAVTGIRRMLDEMTGSYLARRGKKVFCDKSLGSARAADLLVQIYPGAKFLCLYRHPMDVIRSGLDACPFGLSGYGFDQYIAGSPGNAVLALARYWLDHATMIAGVEQAHQGRCHRVRYEDLAADPEGVMARVYEFIGAASAPGVAQACFSGNRERFGPADHKIWATSAVTGDSVGRGESVPAALIVPQVTTAINELASKLGYLPIDGDWGAPGSAADPRVPDTIKGAASPPGTPPDGRSAGGGGPLRQWLQSRLGGADERFGTWWDPVAREKFLVVSRAGRGGGEMQWVVDITARSVTEDDGQADDDDDVAWSILASPEAWQALLSGQANLQAALRRNEVRYCTTGEDSSPVLTQTRVAMLADLLGLGSWRPADTAQQNGAAPLAAVTP
jgi:hypothetical protein